MIVVRIRDGLGNQMFQYATGLAVSIQKYAALRIDDSIYLTDNWVTRHNTRREFGLNVFSLSAPVLSGFERMAVLRLVRRRYAPLRWLLYALGFPYALAIIRDVEGHKHEINPAVAQSGSRVFLDGHWQTEKYFAHIRPRLLKEFTFRLPPEGENSAMLARIQSCQSVGIHVRRTDYTDPGGPHGLCEMEYYARGVEFLCRRVADAEFFVFSDDPGWVVANFPGADGMTVVSHNVGKNDSEDLRLMMNCRHFLVANSTFSWWAAWLGQYPGKIVIAPRRWMGRVHEDQDVVPESWVRL